jgi:pimeloyl-ACP methyl ester carboxylesterase
MALADVRRLRLWQERIETDVEIAGSGPPLIYLHGPWGLASDRGFIARLAEFNTVYAPRFPGTTPGDPDAVHRLDSWLDLIVYHGELFERLQVDAPAVVGHSFGGLLAAEIAAAAPRSIGKLVLIDPVGLWRDDRPVKNWMVLSDRERKPSLFANPDSESAQAFFAVPSDPAARVDALAQMIWSQACTGKFVWPVPDRGAHADSLGHGRPHHRAELCAGLCRADRRCQGRADRRRRALSTSRAARRCRQGSTGVHAPLNEERSA